MIQVGLLSCHKDPQQKIMNYIIENSKCCDFQTVYLRRGVPSPHWGQEQTLLWINPTLGSTLKNLIQNTTFLATMMGNHYQKGIFSLSSIVELWSTLFSILRLNSQNCASLLSSATLKFVNRQTLPPIVYSSRKRFEHDNNNTGMN